MCTKHADLQNFRTRNNCVFLVAGGAGGWGVIGGGSVGRGDGGGGGGGGGMGVICAR